LIQVSQYSPAGKTESHFRNVSFVDNKPYRSSYVDTTPNGQPKNPPPDDLIPYIFHDWFGPGRHAKLLTARMVEKAGDGLSYQAGPAPFAGKSMRVVEIKDAAFPELLSPVDDLPPATVITSLARAADGRLIVRGTCSDNGEVKRVVVNGREARALAPNFLEWEATVDASDRLSAAGEDAAGNAERLAHELGVARP
jgi:hypothetical protein